MENLLTNPRNTDIIYDPISHTYWYKMSRQFKGITGWIKSYCQPFDRANISRAIAIRDGKTQDEVLAEWDEKRDTSAEYGNFVHEAIERWVKGLRLRKGQKAYVDVVKKELKKHGLTPVAAEFVVYDEDYEQASPIDLLCVDTNDQYVVVDMKTYEKGVQWEGYKDQRMLYPLYTVPDANFFHTSLQTAWYIKQLYERWKVSVRKTGYILWLRDTQEGIQCQLIETDADAIEMLNKLYEHEQNIV